MREWRRICSGANMEKYAYGRSCTCMSGFCVYSIIIFKTKAQVQKISIVVIHGMY